MKRYLFGFMMLIAFALPLTPAYALEIGEATGTTNVTVSNRLVSQALSSIYSAHLQYIGSNIAQKGYAKDTLFQLMFWHPLPLIRQARDLLNQPRYRSRDWRLNKFYDAHFMQTLDSAIQWRVSLDRMSADELYNLYLISVRRTKSSRGGAILHLAHRKGSLKAKFRSAQNHFLPTSNPFALPVEKRWEIGMLSLVRLAKKFGFLPAQLDLAERYEQGRQTKINLPKAYFWYTVANQNGGKIGEQKLTQLAATLSRSDRQKLRLIFAGFHQKKIFPEP